MGQLVATLFARYERSYGDTALAAIATHAELDRLRAGRRSQNVGMREALAAASTARLEAWERASSERAISPASVFDARDPT